MNITDDRIEQARQLGHEAGIAAGSWAVDGNTTEEHARRVLAMMADGDPMVEDFLPRRPDLSGEWRHGMTPIGLVCDILDMDGGDIGDHEVTELCEVWQNAADMAFYGECERGLIVYANLGPIDPATLIEDRDHARRLLLEDAGTGTAMPCSRYGAYIEDAVDVIYAAATIVAAETEGAPVVWADIDYMAGLVVNDSPDPEYVIRSYGSLHGIDPATLFDFDPSDDLPEEE